MSTLGMIHTAVAVLAMIVGGVVVLRPKGTSRHKLWGRAYVASMVGRNLPKSGVYAVREGPVLEENLRRLVAEREVGIGQPAGLGIDDQVRLDAAPREGEDVLAIDVPAGPHAQ